MPVLELITTEAAHTLRPVIRLMLLTHLSRTAYEFPDPPPAACQSASMTHRMWWIRC